MHIAPPPPSGIDTSIVAYSHLQIASPKHIAKKSVQVALASSDTNLHDVTPHIEIKWTKDFV
jgi:hypothetical protein